MASELVNPSTAMSPPWPTESTITLADGLGLSLRIAGEGDVPAGVDRVRLHQDSPRPHDDPKSCLPMPIAAWHGRPL
ncbi:hypothetical protein [Streptomyces sp. NPDC050534]|uniref:hypothetical protein n=1 Tax=Streptomyces sp. NPDC050534 TaxID=3365625 RepID=UPI00379F6E20